MQSDDPSLHYDRVTQAWVHLLGEDLHYGHFRSPGETLSGATENLIALMAKRGDIHGSSTALEVLDVGCGIGNPAFYLARRHGCRVTGISTSEVGLTTARKRATELGLAESVVFRHADGMSNGLSDAGWDRVIVLESSHLMPRKDALMAECARVLRPGGCIVLCDVIHRRAIGVAELVPNAKEFNVLRRVFGRAKMEPLEVYKQLAQQSGLEVISCEDISEAVLPTFARWRENAHRHREEVQELIGPESWQQFLEACDVLTSFWEQRLLGYGVIVARKCGH